MGACIGKKKPQNFKQNTEGSELQNPGKEVAKIHDGQSNIQDEKKKNLQESVNVLKKINQK
jgi:hypothetical protein